MLSAITRLFPLWALLLSVLAYYTPSTFTGIGPWVTTLLMLIMFGMGVHLKVDDFKRVLSRPAPVAAGCSRPTASSPGLTRSSRWTSTFPAARPLPKRCFTA